MGLSRRHSLVFLPNTKEISTQLREARPFAFWGSPSFKTVCNLIHKRGAFRDPEHPDDRTALSDNVVIEKHLGDLGVLCTEDLAHAIHTRSNQFGKVTERLWPIKLGDAKKETGKLVNEKSFTVGQIDQGIDNKIVQLLGE